MRVVGNYVFVADGANGLVILEAQPMQRPKLSVALSDTNAIIVWPTSALGFMLESKSDLITSNWFRVLDPPQVDGEAFHVYRPILGQEFYRLRRQ